MMRRQFRQTCTVMTVTMYSVMNIQGSVYKNDIVSTTQSLAQNLRVIQEKGSFNVHYWPITDTFSDYLYEGLMQI